MKSTRQVLREAFSIPWRGFDPLSIIGHEAVDLTLDIGGLGVDSTSNSFFLQLAEDAQGFRISVLIFLGIFRKPAVAPVVGAGVSKLTFHRQPVTTKLAHHFEVIFEM